MTSEPESHLSRAVRYRAESLRCRVLAKQAGVADIAREYQRLAEVYRRLARDAEWMYAAIRRGTIKTD